MVDKERVVLTVVAVALAVIAWSFACARGYDALRCWRLTVAAELRSAVEPGRR
jgi:hypothetical protein